MLEFQEKRRIKGYFYSKFSLGLLIVFIVLLLNGVWKVYQKQDITKGNLDKTATSFEALQAREKKLRSEIERLKTQNGLEEEIRNKYGLVKPGEEVIIITDSSSTESENTVEKKESSFWQVIADWFN